ncbi:probable deoxycytidylate deaminase isoform X1 [Musca autumnalis]|uniref:probable deoxycytidylate deaminase isoform X1 n=1 Tax=Musca autumnalis TaxID=221902 RepID=UPI003CF9D41B
MSSDPSKAEMSQQQATTSDPTESNKKRHLEADMSSNPSKMEKLDEPTTLVPATSEKTVNASEREDVYMGMALLAAKRSVDPYAQVGAVIVSAEQSILSVGYIGFPRGWHINLPLVPECVVHAEADAIIKATRLDLRGAHIYTTLLPCSECAKLIIKAGIKHVHYLREKTHFDRKYEASTKLFGAAGIEYKQHVTEKKEINFFLEGCE